MNPRGDIPLLNLSLDVNAWGLPVGESSRVLLIMQVYFKSYFTSSVFVYRLEGVTLCTNIFAPGLGLEPRTFGLTDRRILPTELTGSKGASCEALSFTS